MLCHQVDRTVYSIPLPLCRVFIVRLLADVSAIIGTMDIVFGEVDR